MNSEDVVVASEEAWDWEPPSFLQELVRELDWGEAVPRDVLGYIAGLARAQEAAWVAAEAEIAEAIFHARYSDPPDLWGEMKEREPGLSWEHLAAVLLCSRETARKRFRDRVQEIRSRQLSDRAEAQEAVEKAELSERGQL